MASLSMARFSGSRAFPPPVQPTSSNPVLEEELGFRAESDPFPLGRYQPVAVKVVDVCGNEATAVRDIGG